MDWIKELLKDVVAEDKLDGALESIKKEFPKHATPKSEFNDKIAEIKTLNETIDAVQAQLKEFEGVDQTIEEYKAKAEKASQELETVKSEAELREKNRNKSDKLKNALSKKANPETIDLLLGKFDIEELNLNEAGEIVDVDSKIDVVLNQYPSLKTKTTVDTPPPPGGNQTPPVDGPDFSQMTDKEYFAYTAANPDK